MQFMVFHDGDKKKVTGILVKSGNYIQFVAKPGTKEPLEIILTRGKIVIEKPLDARTMVAENIHKDDERYLEALKFSLTPPILSSVIGKINENYPKRALEVLWEKFGEDEIPKLVEIRS